MSNPIYKKCPSCNDCIPMDKQSQGKALSKSDIKLILENTGFINKETHKLEHDLFEIDICINKLFESQGKVLSVAEYFVVIKNILDGEEPNITVIKQIATAIHKAQKGE